MKRGTAVSVIILAAALVSAAAGGETLRVAYPSPGGQEFCNGGNRAAAFALDVLGIVAKNCGYSIELRPVDISEGLERLWQSDADMLAVTFRHPEMTRKWDMIPSQLGTVDFTIFSTTNIAAMLRGQIPGGWPWVKLALVKGSLASKEYFREWNIREQTKIYTEEYPSAEAALAALESGDCSLVFNEVVGRRKEGFEALVKLGECPYFAAVRSDRQSLFEQLELEYERFFACDSATVDALRAKHFGYQVPPHRVRVGCYFEPGLCEPSADGTMHGANNDYVNRIAEIAGWNVEWVNCRYSRALKYLEKGQIDALAGVTITEERLKAFDFPHLATGLYRSYLFCRNGAPYRPGRFSEWRGAVIATGHGEQARRDLMAFLKDRGAECTVREYPSFAESMYAYFRGECQIVHTAASTMFAREKPLHVFDAVPAYVVTTSKRPDLGLELQKSLEKINADSPGFHDEVARRNFLPRQTVGFHLTDEERAYLFRRRVNGDRVRVEIFPEVRPLKFWQNGHPCGFAKALFEIADRKCDLGITFLEPVDLETAKKRFLEGECDFWIDYQADSTGLPFRFGTIDSVSLMDILICRRDTDLYDPASGRVAVPEWELKSYGAVGGRVGRSEYLKPCQTIEDCIRAVKERKADCVVCSVLVAAAALRDIDPEAELDVRPPDIARRRVPFRLVPSLKADPRLVSIVRKLMGSFTELEIETAESSSIVDFIHPETSIWIRIAGWVLSVLAVVVLVVIIYLLIRIRVRSEDVLHRERRVNHRDRFILSTARELEASLELIASRAEYLRNPEVKREHALKWTAEIIDNADMLVSRFRRFIKQSERHADRLSRLEKIRGGELSGGGDQ